jgi:hypothetical protein
MNRKITRCGDCATSNPATFGDIGTVTKNHNALTACASRIRGGASATATRIDCSRSRTIATATTVTTRSNRISC